MKVFISWSGEMSRQVALALRGWLPDVLNEVEPWMSDEDIDKGSVGLAEVATALSKCSFGIVCLTQENQHRDWVNFEAGALAKSVGDDPTRVATLLIDQAGPSEITGPLAQFQATKLSVEDITKLLRSLNKVATAPRPDEAIDRAVETWWPRLERSISMARKSLPDTTPAPPRRSERALLEEILTLTRDLANTLGPQAAEQARAAVEYRQRAEGTAARAAAWRDVALPTAGDRDLAMAEADARIRQAALSNERALLQGHIANIIERRAPEADYSVGFSEVGAHVAISGISLDNASRLQRELTQELTPVAVSVRLVPSGSDH